MPNRNQLIPFAIAMLLGTGNTPAQAVLDVGGAGVIGDTVLTTSGGNTRLPLAGANWAAAGGTGIVYSNLTSPPVSITTGGPATLRFSHRYNFENGWDGGAVYVSVNGGTFTHLPAATFSSNGYVGNLTGNGSTVFTGGEEVFTGTSDGFATPAYIESVAALGSLTAGDTITVRFRGGWDDVNAQNPPPPNWQLTSVKVTDAAAASPLDITFIDSAADFTVTSDPTLSGPWTYPAPTLRFELNADNLTADRYVPNAAPAAIDLDNATIQVALLTGTLDPGDTFSLFNLTGGSTLTGTVGSISLPPLGTWDTSNLATNGTITFVAEPPNLTWNLASGGAWDTITANWTADGGATTTNYSDGALVTFNKAEGGTITVTGMSPASTTVNSDGNYTLVSLPIVPTDLGAPSILSGTLVKSGTGILQLGVSTLPSAGTNAYSNGFSDITVNAGTLIYASRNAFGNATVTMEGGTTLKKVAQEGNGAALALANNFILNGEVTVNTVFGGQKDQWFSGVIAGAGSIKVTGERRAVTLAGNNTFTGGVIMENYVGTGATAPYNLDIGHVNSLGTGTLTVKTLLNPSLVQFRGLGTTTALTADAGVANDIVIDPGATFYLGRGQNLRLSGDISGGGTLFKRNTTTVFLDGSNTYSGGTKVEAGTLTINGSLADSSMSIVGVTLSAVNYAGTVDGTGTLTFNIDGVTNDQIKMTSATSPVGTLTATDLKIAVNATGAGLTESEYVLVDATGGGTITGTFASLTGAAGYELNYGIPNQVKLVKVTSGSPFNNWSGGAAADADTNGDGVDNGVAWVVGAANPSANAVGLIPALDNTTDPDFFIFNYRRNDLAATDPKTAITVQYSSGLSAWIGAIESADIVITPTNDFYAGGIDKVEVKIRRTLAVGGRFFARLRVAVATP